MERPGCVAELFRLRPERWGLRGDPYLWTEMERRFEGVPCPATPEELVALIEEAFQELTGHPLSSAEPLYVKQFAHGGMSSGMVFPQFWRETAIPLLCERLTSSRISRAQYP
jgi:hypothetical protein